MSPTTDIARPSPTSASPVDTISVSDWRGPAEPPVVAAADGAVTVAMTVAAAVGVRVNEDDSSAPDGKTRAIGPGGIASAAGRRAVGAAARVAGGDGGSVGRNAGSVGPGGGDSTGT